MKRADSSVNPEAEWFGYERVAPEAKTARVGAVFSSVAENYDLMNDLMSGGLHRLWKDHFVSKMRPRPDETILDVAGGTGDIALRCAQAMGTPLHKSSLLRFARNDGERGDEKTGAITVCDINPDMLRVGRAKAMDAGWLGEIDWIAGSAEALPVPDASVDLCCISFGLRNVTHIDQALSEFARVLRPGGRFFCMEFSPGVAKPLRGLYDLYSFTVLPWLGEKVADDRAAYQYLAESIRQFPPQEELAARMKKAGLAKVRYENLMGGIAAIHSGWVL